MEYGLIGEKLGHSYSKIIHELLGCYSYDLYPISKDNLVDFILSKNFKGLNVTIPYKQDVMPLCSKVSELAKEIGAVNTLYFDENNTLCGTNTDYYGFLYAINRAGINLYNKKVLILGDGATCKTMRKAVLDSGANEIIIASRKVTNPIFEHFKSDISISPFEMINCTTINYDDLTAQPDVEIIINTTPVGMWPNTQSSPIDLRKFQKCSGVFDVIYNPYYTKLLTQAKELDIPHAGGLAMLVAQATCAAEYFTGFSQDFSSENERIIEELQKQINERL
ncbi:MAG: shikimate dehydrogenase family protein [Aminipila sp.]